MVRALAGALLISLLCSGCRSPGARVAAGGEPAPLFEGIGDHHRSITTRVPLAQRYFDQGLVWAFAFNHDEAIRSFNEALQHDPSCAAAWWGIALCNGPHINNPIVDEPHARAAWDALQRARGCMASTGETERALIEALSARYADPPPTDRRPLDEAYAAAMRKVWNAHRSDADVGTLFAEALMDLQPWDLWTREQKPKGNTEEILAVLQEVLRLNPEHPGANHLYIHAVEAGPHPEWGNDSADRLRRLVPAAGHLVHMPSHIDVQTGRWAQAAEQNVLAAAADARYREISPRQGFYRVYMAHNHHFLAFASMMQGRYQAAIQAARTMIAGIPTEFIAGNGPLIDPYMMIEYEVLMRFGRWDDILHLPEPPAGLPITRCFRYFVRGVARAATGGVADAESERADFENARRDVPDGALMAINPAKNVLDIADRVLRAEIAYRKGDIASAVDDLRAAVAIEDRLMYMEPPDWIQPVRHTLGAILTEAGRFQDAEQVYREDLDHWPENGWSLHGLATCLKARGATADADQVERRFRAVWARADTPIASSCLCVTGKPATTRP